jgi:hypothetical protein
VYECLPRASSLMTTRLSSSLQNTESDPLHIQRSYDLNSELQSTVPLLFSSTFVPFSKFLLRPDIVHFIQVRLFIDVVFIFFAL